MTQSCNRSNSSHGPPEWVRRKIEARISRDRGLGCPFTADDCCHSQMQFLSPWLRQDPCSNMSIPHDLYGSCERYSCTRDSDSSMLHRKPPFWLRNKCHFTKSSIINTDVNKGPPKSVIIEMLGLKRDYLNTKLNSLDSHIKKLKEEVKEKDNNPENNLWFDYLKTILFSIFYIYYFYLNELINKLIN